MAPTNLELGEKNKVADVFRKNHSWILWPLLLLTVGLSPLPQHKLSASGSDPVIEFTFVPPYGSSLNLQGRVRNVTPESFKVAVYIFIEGAGWWTKPTFARPLTPIQSDSTWSVDITTGGSDIFATRIQAFLLPEGVNPSTAGGLACLPENLNTLSVAAADTMRTPRIISFSGYPWRVKASVDPVGPGPNFFSDSSENLWVDIDGHLHLKITERNGWWYCPEVILDESLGYGRYVFQIAGHIGQINENAVLGLFTWDNEACSEYHREIDIEFSRWGNAQENLNAEYVVQPYTVPGNLQKWHLPVDVDSSTHSFEWGGDSILFVSARGHSSAQSQDSIIYSWTYTGADIPVPGSENVRMNLWLFRGQPPSDGNEIEVVITRFEFFPPQPVSINDGENPIIKGYRLAQNFPNPFNPATRIFYTIPEENRVTIKVFDLLGREVAVLVDKHHPPGDYKVEWQFGYLTSGIYFYQMTSGKFVATRKMLLLR